MLEKILSALRVKNDKALLTLEGEGSFFLADYKNHFATCVLKSDREADWLAEALKKDEKTKDFEITKKDHPFPLVGIKAPIELRHHLKQYKQFETGHIVEGLRWNIAPPWSVVEVEEGVVKALKEKKRIDEKILGFENEIGNKTASNLFHLFFGGYDGGNYESVVSRVKENSRTKKYADLADKRKGISDSIKDLNMNLDEGSYADFYDRNKNKAGSKNYVFDLNIACKNLKYKRMLNFEEVFNRKWLLFDTETPFYKEGGDVRSISAIETYRLKVDRKIAFNVSETGEKVINGYLVRDGFKDSETMIDAAK